MTETTLFDASLRRANGGAVAVIERVVQPAVDGPPLHVQPSLDETFYVLEGNLTFRVGDALFTALTGASVFAGRGIPHTYANQSRKAARIRVVCTPAGGPATASSSADVRQHGQIHRTQIVGPSLER
jgi:quercetin dioxygenase-like cupin family protein